MIGNACWAEGYLLIEALSGTVISFRQVITDSRKPRLQLSCDMCGIHSFPIYGIVLTLSMLCFRFSILPMNFAGSGTGKSPALVSAGMVEPSIMTSHAWKSLPTLQYVLRWLCSPDERTSIGVLTASRILAMVEARVLLIMSIVSN